MWAQFLFNELGQWFYYTYYENYFFHLLNYFFNNGESKKDFWHMSGMAAVRSTREWRDTSISADTRRYLVTEIRGRSQAGVGDNSLHAHELRQQASDTWPTTSYTSINF